MEPGLQARVHDPLWLLGRQWQARAVEGAGILGRLGAVGAGQLSQASGSAGSGAPWCGGDAFAFR